MLRVGIALPLGVSMMVLGQTAIGGIFPGADLLLSGSALGVLTWVVWYLLRHFLPQERKAFARTLDVMSERHERMQTEASDRHERWEKQRHDDSDNLAQGLSELAVTCAASQALIKSQGCRDG